MAAGEAEIVEIELRDYVRPLAQHKRLIVLVTLLVLGPALAWSFLADPVYEAKARVLVQPSGRSLFRAPPITSPIAANRLVQTEILVFESPQIKAKVEARLGRAPEVAALQVSQTDVIEIIARSDLAEEAAAIANAYASAYIELRREQSVADVVAAAEQLQAKVSELQAEIDQASGQQQNALIDQQALFRQKLDELQVDSAVAEGGARLISDAAVPRAPVSPDPIRTAIIALVFGVILGVGAALAVEYLDDTITTPEQLERLVPEVNVIGTIPAVPGWRNSQDPVVVSLEETSSPAAEAFRTLRTSLQFLLLERGIGTVQVTSPNPGDGKSSTVANLAVAIARAGSRVVVVDCDLRRPRVADFFGIDASVGLTSVLVGDVPLAGTTVAVPGVPRLAVLPAGPPPPNPSEVLSTRRMAELITSLRNTGAVVIIDSPPVLPVTDALVLSSRADATLLVCAARRTTRKQVRRSVELLENVKAPLVGIVLNAIPEQASYKGTYAYGYGNAPGTPARRAAPAPPGPPATPAAASAGAPRDGGRRRRPPEG